MPKCVKFGAASTTAGWGAGLWRVSGDSGELQFANFQCFSVQLEGELQYPSVTRGPTSPNGSVTSQGVPRSD
jgi:hypothetical protein